MGITTLGKKKFPLTLISLLIAVILIAAGCSGGGGGVTASSDTSGTSGDTSGSTGSTGGTSGGTSSAKATLSGTLLSSSSSSGSSLFKKLKKSAAATSSLPVSGATVLCFDTDSVSTAAAGSSTTGSTGTWTMDVSEGNYVCFGVYIDLATLTIKTTKMDDIAAVAGESVTVGEATVESDTTSPTIVSVLADNTADTSLSDGDPDPLYEAADVLPSQAISIIFSEAMNTSTMAAGTGVVLKDSSGNTVPTTLSFNGQGTEFRYTPNSPLTTSATYILYISNKVKDLSNNGINDPDSDGVVALARITVTDHVDSFSYLSSSPKDGDTGVSVYKDLNVAFNRPVDFVSFKDHTTISPAVSGRLEPSGDGVTFSHNSPLAANTEYTVTIGADVEDLAGNKLGSAKALKFNTGAGVDANSVKGFDAGGGTADDLLAIVANVTKAELAMDNQDIVSFASFFAPTFTMKEKKCSFNPDAGMTGTNGGTGTVSGPKLAKEGDPIMNGTATGTGPAPSGAVMPPPGEVCTTNTFTLAEFLANMKKDMLEERNMSKGFGEVQRLMLTNATGSKMSVEHFNSDFDADRNPTGKDLYVGMPNRREGVDFVNSEIDVPDSMNPNGTRREFVTYRLSGECRDLTSASEKAGAGEVLASYHYWNQQTQRDEMKTRICPVYDGDANSTNSWANDDEVYPSDWTGPKNVWEDNDQDCSHGMWDCQNEDGLISLKDTNSDGIPDKAVRYYENVDQNTHMRSANEQDITSALVSAGGGLNVAAAMRVAANNHWDIEGVDNDGDSRIMYFNPDDHSQGGFIDRHINEDMPNGMDDDNDGKIDEDGDGLGNNPQPIDGDSDFTNDPMPHSDWNLANNENIISNDEFWAQTYLIIDPLFAPSGAAQWRDADNNVYYEIPGPRGWPYPYAAGQDGKPWSGDEFDQNNGPDLNGHVFTWADVSILGKVYFRNDDKSGGAFSDNDRNVYLDLTAAGFNIVDGVITNPTERVQSGEKAAAIFRWDGSGHLSNSNGQSIDWQFNRPLMDHIDYNADGDWNVNTNPTAGLRRVPHDRATGGIMSSADYLALGWDTWRVSNDLQLVRDPSIVWDVEADWARMEGDDDGDGQFNEDGLYSDYFNSDGSLKVCLTQANYPCMTRDSSTDQLVLHKKDGTSTTSFDISDGIDNNGNGEIDEVEPFDDDGDGKLDEDPPGDPNDADGNGDTTAAYDDDGDGRKDEDPVSYERDRMNDHGQWAKVYQETTDAVVDMFYLTKHTGLEVADIVIDEAGTKATAIVNLVNTETWTPHNPWGDDFNHDGEPDDVNTWTETMVFNMEKSSSKWLMTGIQPVDSLEDYAQQVASGDIKQFGGEVAHLKMISPAGDPMSGPPANQTVTPTFVWDDSEVKGTIGSYLIHIEEITEAMTTGAGQPTTVMMVSIAASDVTTDTATGARSFTLGSGGDDITADVLLAFKNDEHFPFTSALTALEEGKAYAWGILAFEETQAELATAFAGGKPEPLGDTFEPRMFATTSLPSYLATPTFGTTGSKGSVAKVKVGGIEYHAIPSNIAPHLYGSISDSGDAGHAPSSLDPRSRR
ncbi:MAG: Ig-like domain-containing protein [Nitrospirae bacterium]|nr:Ig-like domain-containing protein [Nitrospirota bacterium]